MRTRVNLLLTGLLVTALIGGGPAMAQTIQEKVTTIPGKTIYAADESAISSAATKVLRNIAKARGAIHDKDPEQAKSDLHDALQLIDIIKVSLPTTKIKDHIWVAGKHLDYEDTDTVLPDLIPIYADLADIEDFVPVAQTRKHLDAAKQGLKKGDKNAAKESLREASNLLVYTEIDLPLAATERAIIAAQAMLTQKQLDEANETLKGAEANILVISTSIDGPITQAKKSLWNATTNYTAGKYAVVKNDLAEAQNSLKKAAQNLDGKTRNETQKLGKEINALKGKIENGGKDVGATIAGLWERGKALSERELERIPVGWGKTRTESKVKADLIDAKLHLAYAESYQFTSNSLTKAKSEIKEVETSLKSGLKHADSTTMTKISAINKEFSALKNDLNTKAEATKARYEKIQSDLLQLIRIY